MYRPFETFLFRTPYFPFSALSDFDSKQNDTVFREMLQIASPDLSEGMDKGEDKTQNSAYRYYQRACTRPTPLVCLPDVLWEWLAFGRYLSKFAAGSIELQPRISARYLITPLFTAKASYSRMAQYVHLLTSSSIGFPTDLWLPATARLRPQTSHQTAIGLAHHFRDDYEISLEGYYKTMANVVEYMEGATLFNLDEAWEQKVVQGAGRSYGAELFVQKKTGSFTGWAGYTLAWTDRHFEELNGGKRFPYKYDTRHDISIAWMQRIEYYNWRRYKDRTFELSGAWVFSSGNCVTIPVGFFYARHPTLLGNNNYNWMRYFDYGERNGYRMKPYHRLDFSCAFVKQKKWCERRWIFGVYNVYNRKNPYFIHVEEKEDSNYPTSQMYTDFKFVQWSLFPFIPYVSYQLKF